MSLQATKDHLVKVLDDADNKVIALSGKWGTGKSHLWREVREASKDDKVRQSLYVSLFGLSDMSQIKLKIIQNALPKAEEQYAMWEKARIGYEGLKKVLTSIHKGFSALDELALLAVPTILKDKVIVLDDIERKHEKLSIDEILGFIDEFTQQHGARFVLVLNSDQLANRVVWDTLREKVIDQEIRLDTSSSEAFGIAIGLTPSPYAERVRNAVEICGVTNIRINSKIIKALNRILGDRKNLSEAVLARVIPSTVVLAAINYKGIENGPDFDFVLSLGTHRDWSSCLDKDKELDEEGKRKAKWKLMLNELGINGCDDYELLVVEFLQSGLFNVGAVSAIIDRYVAETEVMEASDQTHQFFRRLMWDHRLTETELLEEAKALIQKAHLVDAYSVTALAEQVSKLPDGTEMGEAMIKRWVEEFRAKNIANFDEDNHFHRPIHPLIQAEFSAIQAKAQAKTTVFDACNFIAKHSGWGSREEMVMKSASVKDFEATIKLLDIPDLRVFMRKMLELRIQKQTYLAHFGSAMDYFTEACRNIARDPQSGRLGKLIRELFKDAKLVDQLDADDAQGQ